MKELMKHSIAVLGALVLKTACGAVAPSAPTSEAPSALGHAAALSVPFCLEEGLECFTAKAHVGTESHQATATVVSQDLPLPGYENRWRYVISAETRPVFDHLLGKEVESEVCVEAVVTSEDPREGAMIAEVYEYWTLKLQPVNQGVRVQLGKIAPAVECRDQRFVFTLLPGGEYELLITEPK